MPVSLAQMQMPMLLISRVQQWASSNLTLKKTKACRKMEKINILN